MGGIFSKAPVQTGMNAPKHLLEAWEEVRLWAAKARRLVLLTDFDGTLVRIQKDPHQVRLSRALRQSLSVLVNKGITVGVISGRTMDDIRSRVHLDGIWYVGSHGYTIRPPKGRPTSLVTPEGKRLVAAARRNLIRQLSGSDGIYVEAKSVSVAVHYRSAPWPSQVRGLESVRNILRENSGLRLLTGKKVWELLPDSAESKWSGVQYVFRDIPASQRLVFYFGDDESDEEVFARLDGVSVAVGKHRQTNARYYLNSPSEVHQFLKALQQFANVPSSGC